jgi:c-di-GMP-binding flagellar brake protein YcgR
MLPSINQNVYIDAASPQNGEPSTLRTKVAGEDAENLYLETPLDEKTGRYRPLHRGENVLVWYLSKGVRCEFDSIAGDVSREGALLLYAIRKPAAGEIRRIQRRQYFRVEAELELGVRIGERVQFVTKTEDIGGGGLSFQCDAGLPVARGLRLSCWLLVKYRSGNVERVPFDAEVVRTEEIGPSRRRVMVQFSYIQETDRDKIIRFCIEKELANRRK